MFVSIFMLMFMALDRYLAVIRGSCLAKLSKYRNSQVVINTVSAAITWKVKLQVSTVIWKEHKLTYHTILKDIYPIKKSPRSSSNTVSILARKFSLATKVLNFSLQRPLRTHIGVGDRCSRLNMLVTLKSPTLQIQSPTWSCHQDYCDHSLSVFFRRVLLYGALE